MTLLTPFIFFPLRNLSSILIASPNVGTFQILSSPYTYLSFRIIVFMSNDLLTPYFFFPLRNLSYFLQHNNCLFHVTFPIHSFPINTLDFLESSISTFFKPVPASLDSSILNSIRDLLTSMFP